MSASNKSATLFHRLHQGPDVLRLANCWDAGSARLVESLGAKALATTSAGLAWSNGYPDGDVMPLERLVAAVGAIARVIKVPLSVDMESGYARDIAGVADSVAGVIDAGGVGCNLEDGAGTVETLCGKIEQAKKGSARRNVEFWVNARTDVYLRELATPDKRVAETIARAKRYRNAGADSLFVPGLADPKEIREIAGAIQVPLNVMAWSGLPPAAELGKLGVKRLSAGSSISAAVWGRTASLVKAFLSERSDALADEAMGYSAINRLFQ
jgi:2-methylisocitrate lyase-like PEP mutase family enzyme